MQTFEVMSRTGEYLWIKQSRVSNARLMHCQMVHQRIQLLLPSLREDTMSDLTCNIVGLL